MKEETTSDKEMTNKPKLTFSEKDCPKCHYVIIKNEKEDCYECLNCGYIDCGFDDE